MPSKGVFGNLGGSACLLARPCRLVRTQGLTRTEQPPKMDRIAYHQLQRLVIEADGEARALARVCHAYATIDASRRPEDIEKRANECG